jgi:hypothetical protein
MTNRPSVNQHTDNGIPDDMTGFRLWVLRQMAKAIVGGMLCGLAFDLLLIATLALLNA